MQMLVFMIEGDGDLEIKDESLPGNLGSPL